MRREPPVPQKLVRRRRDGKGSGGTTSDRRKSLSDHFLLKVQTFLPLPTDPTPEKPVMSPICTAVNSEPSPMGKEPHKCGFTDYMGRVIYSLSS